MKAFKVLGVGLFALCAFLSLSASVGAQPSAGSYDVNITCGSFSNDQAAAQAYFDANDQPANLDQNGDGLACADPSDGDFTGGPTAGSYDVDVTCDDFAGDSDAAQSYFDSNDAPVNLDQDGDGIACNDAASITSEDANDSTAQVTALPKTGSGMTQPGTPFITVVAMMSGLVGAAVLSKRLKSL